MNYQETLGSKGERVTGAGGKHTMAPKRDYIFPIVDDNSNVTHSLDPKSKSFPFDFHVR